MKNFRACMLLGTLLLVFGVGGTDRGWAEGIKEIREVPSYNVTLPDEAFVSQGKIHYTLTHVSSHTYKEIVKVLALSDELGIEHVVIHLNSGGGSAFDGMAAATLLRDYSNKGKVVEVRGQGLVASAAVIILASGSPGYRYLYANSLLMVHELSVFKFAEVLKTKDLRKEAEVMSLIQNTMIGFVSNLIHMDPKELEVMVDAETWLTAKKAVELGFADELVELNGN